MRSDRLIDAIGKIKDEYIADAHGAGALPAEKGQDGKGRAARRRVAGAQAGMRGVPAGASLLRMIITAALVLAAATAGILHMLPGDGEMPPDTAIIVPRLPVVEPEGPASSDLRLPPILEREGPGLSERPAAAPEPAAPATQPGSEPVTEPEPGTGPQAPVTETPGTETPGTDPHGSEEEDPVVPVPEGASLPVPGRGSAVHDPQDPTSLTAAEWNDNEHWNTFLDLLGKGRLTYPLYGMDPRGRVVVTVHDTKASPLAGEPVGLYDRQGRELWRALTDRNGRACLFAGAAGDAATVVSGESAAAVSDGRAELVIDRAQNENKGIQVMFVVDTTASMREELEYLQQDFISIAAQVDGRAAYAVDFYRDTAEDPEESYVVKASGFTDDPEVIESLLAAETASGGGDTEEAVADALELAVADEGWAEDSGKVIFLMLDAPPHGYDADRIDAVSRAAAAAGIHIVPIAAKNQLTDDRTEAFGRGLAALTNGSYVYITEPAAGGSGDGSTPGAAAYEVEYLHDIIVRIIDRYR